MKKLIISILLFLAALAAFAQTEGAMGYYHDAMLFSRTYVAGTARMQAIGGAQVSLGGDASAANVNPAGLGFFNRSTFTITPSFNLHNSTSDFNGEIRDDFRNNFNFGQIGIVFNQSINHGKSLYKGHSFAISLTRINDFYNDSYIDFSSDENSIIDAYIDRAWGIEPDRLPDDLYYAYSQYLIDPYYPEGSSTPEYESIVLGYPQRQTEEITQSGKQYQWDFSYGGNLNDILYFGLGAGINTLDYWVTNLYIESDYEWNGEPDEALYEMSTENRLRVNGVGVGATAGLIFRPANILRIGVAVKTPTYYNLNDESSDDLQTIYNNYEYITPDTTIVLDSFYDLYQTYSIYNLNTPWKYSVGGSIFLGKVGFISADVDYIDYSKAKIKSSDFSAHEDNLAISSLYQSTFNYRLGTELRIGPMRLRAGYNYMGDPYVNNSIDQSITRISGGLGYRNKDMFVDLSVVHSQYKSLRTPYTFYDGTGPQATLENQNLNVSLTLGFNF